MLRALRLAKLARLIRMSRLVKRWETRNTVNYAMLSLWKAMGTIVLMAHWISCSNANTAILEPSDRLLRLRLPTGTRSSPTRPCTTPPLDSWCC